MESKEPIMWPNEDKGEKNGCIAMFCCLVVIIFVALCWGFYEFFKVN